MAVSERIKAEAKRTIDGMQRFAAKYGYDVDDAEELEHRIARVEASMEGCNGLTPEDKLQKTAENVFELTCAQERSYDALRMELKRNREEHKRECEDIKAELKKGLDDVMKKIEDSGMDSSSSMGGHKSGYSKAFFKIISEHPLLAFNAFIFVSVLVFVSGYFEVISKLCGGGK